MGWQEFVGYLGSLLLFSTFWMRTMIPLRIAAIAGNLSMATYAAMAGFYPMVGLQLLALPVNVATVDRTARPAVATNAVPNTCSGAGVGGGVGGTFLALIM